MQSFVDYILEHMEDLGGAIPYKNKDKFYLNFYLHYGIDFTLEPFALKINDIQILSGGADGEEVSVEGASINKKVPINDIFSSWHSTYYPEYKEINKQYKNIDYTLRKKTPQCLLRNIDLSSLLLLADYEKLRCILSSIDPTFSIYKTIKDEKTGTTNDAELRLKDLLSKHSGILNIGFKTYFECRYKLLIRPIYYKNKNEIARYDVSIVQKILSNPTEENEVHIDIYDVKPYINDATFDRTKLREFIDKNEISPYCDFVGNISFENRHFIKFLNKFVVNKFEINKKFLSETTIKR